MRSDPNSLRHWSFLPGRDRRFGMNRTVLGLAGTALLMAAWAFHAAEGELHRAFEEPWKVVALTLTFLVIPLAWNLQAVRNGAPRFWPTWGRALKRSGAAFSLSFAVAYMAESWHSRAAWNQLDAELRARGRPLTFEELMGPRPAAELDAARHPLIQGLDAGKPLNPEGVEDRQPSPGEQRAKELMRLLALPSDESVSSSQPRTPGWDLSEMAGLLRKENRSGLPPPPPGLPAAKAVLFSLEARRELFHQIADLSSRPEHRPELGSAGPASHPTRHLAVFKKMAENLHLRASARIAVGDAPGAFEDVATLRRIGRLLERDPILISFAVHRSIERMELAAFWEGVRDGAWDDAQLAGFGRHFASTSQKASWIRAIEGERILHACVLELLRESPRLRREYTVASTGYHGIESHLVVGYPDAWLRLGQTQGCRDLDTLVKLLEATDPGRALASGDSVWRTQDAEAGYLEATRRPVRWWDPFRDFDALELPRNRLKADRVLVAQRMAGVVCALERHRLVHGAYPERLESIETRFRESLPDDPLRGRPFGYRLPPDGAFRLYSVGNDLVDDGGDPSPRDPVPATPGPTDSKPVQAWDSFDNDRNCDWVWPSPVPTGEERLF